MVKWFKLDVAIYIMANYWSEKLKVVTSQCIILSNHFKLENDNTLH